MDGNLSRKQEELLLKFLDNEAGFFETRKARNLIKNNEAARKFISEIDKLGMVMEDWHADLIRENRIEEVNLWERVEQRIAQEERAALFLGERRDSGVPEGRKWLFGSSLRETFLGKDLREKGLWALAGGTVSAVLVFAVIQLGAIKPTNISSDMSAVASSASVPLKRFSHNVALNPRVPTRNAPMMRPRISPKQLQYVYLRRAKKRVQAARVARELDSPHQTPVVIEWIRSDGKLSLIPTSRYGETVIWVKRDKGEVSGLH